MNTTIVYDRSNIDSVIAATLIKKLFPLAVFISNYVIEKFDNYIFLGVKPNYQLKQLLINNHKNFIIVDDYVTAGDNDYGNERLSFTLTEAILKLEEIDFITDGDLTIDHLTNFKDSIKDLPYMQLSLLIHIFIENKDKRFFNAPLVALKNQALVWTNYIAALHEIDTGEVFVPSTDHTVGLLDSYVKFLDTVKNNISRVYYIEKFETHKGKKLTIFCCNIRQDVQPFALKIASNVYRNVLLFEHVGNNLVVRLHSPNDSLEFNIKRFFTANAIFNDEVDIYKNPILD